MGAGDTENVLHGIAELSPEHSQAHSKLFPLRRFAHDRQEDSGHDPHVRPSPSRGGSPTATTVRVRCASPRLAHTYRAHAPHGRCRPLMCWRARPRVTGALPPSPVHSVERCHTACRRSQHDETGPVLSSCWHPSLRRSERVVNDCP